MMVVARGARWRRRIGRWGCWLLLSLLAGPAWGQFALTSQMTKAERDRLYHELVQDVAALERQSNVLKKVVQLARCTVVHIEARKNQDGFSRNPIEEAGSGVVVEYNDANYVLTNRHVIKQATLDNIHIRLASGHIVVPTRVWADAETDIAVMAVDSPHLVPARLGDSGTVEIGDFVLAVGSPFGLSHSVTDGVKYQNFFQTDAAINPGNSGGPLLNLRGEVIGINTAIASNSGRNEGIGFAIPVNIAMFVATQLVDQGSVVRAILGVVLDSEYDDAKARQLGLPRRIGARVNRVNSGTVAESVGILVNDVILTYDEVEIEDLDHLVNQVKLTPIGREVRLVVLREGRAVELVATMRAPPIE
jgi:serine protease Do